MCDETLVTVYRSRVDSTYVPKPGEPGFEQGPWPKLERRLGVQARERETSRSE